MDLTGFNRWQSHTDKGWAHGYFEVYARFLHRRRVESIVEIGVLAGESIRMWSDLYPDARIVGIDTENVASLAAELPNVDIIVADAYDIDTLFTAALHGPFDLIIDDGSHRLRDQCWTAEHWTRHLAPGGLLVIEDIASIHNAHLIAEFLHPDMVGWASIVDRRCAPSGFPYASVAERNDILLIVDLP